MGYHKSRGARLTEAGQRAGLAERSMQLQAPVQEGALTLRRERGSVHVEPLRWK